MRHSPLIPFGSRVLAHLPLALQTPSTARGFPTIAVGRASYTKGGIRLFNPETKRIILRRTFKVMSQLDRQPTSALDQINVEISLGDDMLPESIAAETGGITQDSDLTPDLPVLSENPGVCPAKPESYRQMSPSEVHKNKRHYFKHINKQFIDTATDERFCIVAVELRTTVKRGPGSQTLFYSFYDTRRFPGSPLSQNEHMPCVDLLSSHEIVFDDTANALTFAAIIEARNYLNVNSSALPKAIF